MAVAVSCPICSERLDERDVVKNNIVCWKCGWKSLISLDKLDEEPFEDMVNIWLPYD